MALNWLDQLLSFVVKGYVNSLWISWPENLLTEIAGDWDSFQMVCLDVVSHLPMDPLFSANIANIDRQSMLILSWTFCHQRVDLFVKILYVSRVFICYGYGSNLRIFWGTSRRWLCNSCFFVFEGCIFGNRNFWGLCRYLLFSLVWFPHQPSKLKLLSNGKKRIQVFLIDICFSTIEEVKNSQKIFWFHPSHVE